MRAELKQQKPIIFGNYKEVLQTLIMFYFAANLVFGEKEEESEFCKTGWSEFVKDRKEWEHECLQEDIIKISPCCKETADYLEDRYENYINLCPIIGRECVCNFQEREIDRIAHGNTSDSLSWTKPNISCSQKFQINHQQVEPNVKSPHRFPIGLNKIKNIFQLYGGKNLTCTILIYVRSCDNETEEMDEKNGKEPGCKKDILVLWYNSIPVSFKFLSVVKKVLKTFVGSKKLCVEEQGTQIGFITLSNDNQTRKLLKVGEIKNKTLLTQWFDSFDYENDSFTKLELAKNVFNVSSPKNFRPEVEDVILLLIGGSHNASENQTKLVDEYTRILKKRNITVVGLVVGSEDEIKMLKPYVERWPSTELLFESRFEGLDKVVNQIVNALCETPGECKCRDGDIYKFTTYVGRYENNGLVHWPVPEVTCSEYEGGQIDPPDVSSPAIFSLGKHVITFLFSHKHYGQIVEFKCFVHFTVTRCHCPCNQTVNAQVQGDWPARAIVSWSEPKPRCPTTPSPGNPRRNDDLLSVGNYMLYYNYTHSSKNQTFSVQCHVRIFVRDASKCQEKIDIVFVLDRSGSINPGNYRQMQRFVKYVASKLNVGVRNDAGDVIGQGAIVSFSESAEIEILLSESATPGAFDRAVDAMEGPLPGGRTYTTLGLELADRYVVQKTGGYRDDDDVKHILIVITDGEQTKGRGYVPVKEAIKPFFDRNMDVFAVGVGLDKDEAKQEIQDMVRSNANAFFATSFTDLLIQANHILLKFCPVCGTKRDDCHPALATCTDIELAKYKCRCIEGYIGDGRTCVACECSSAQRVRVKVNIGRTNASVSWLEPKPTCPTTPNPNNTRHTRGQFPVGNYKIIYQYTHTTESKSFKLQCDVNIVVTGRYCGKRTYDPASHNCCRGKTYRKKSGYKCCGKNYYNPAGLLCCRDASIVSVGKKCPV